MTVVTRNEAAFVLALCGFSLYPSGPAAVLVVAAMFLHYWSGRPRAALFGVYAAFAVVLQGLLVDMLGPSPSGDDGGSRVDYSNPAASWGFISTGWLPVVIIPFCVLGVVGAWLLPLPVLPPALHAVRGLTVTMARQRITAVKPRSRQSASGDAGAGAGAGAGAAAADGDNDLDGSKPDGKEQQEPGNANDNEQREQDNSDDDVECNLQLFYATNVEVGWLDKAPYFPDGKRTARGLTKFANLPRWLMDHLVHVDHETYEYEEEVNIAPFGAQAKLPLVVFSHGLGGVPSLYMSIIQELAGQGVLVLAVEHADGSGAFTDAPSGPLPYQPLTKEERKDTQRQFERRNGQLQRRVAEVRLALDHVVEWVQRPASRGPSSGDIHRVLFNRVDLRRIAVAGHSFGGATALSAASHDPRFAAVVALDPWMFPLDVSSVCTDALRGVPVLTMFGDGFTKWKANAESAQALLLRSDKAAFSNANPELVKKHGESSASETADTGAGASAASTPKKDDGRSHRHTRIITLHGAQHQSFNDLPFFAERVMRLMKEVGSLPQEKATRVITTSTLAFLHTVLRDIDSKRYFLGPQTLTSLQDLADGLMDVHCTQWQADAPPPAK